MSKVDRMIQEVEPHRSIAIAEGAPAAVWPAQGSARVQWPTLALVERYPNLVFWVSFGLLNLLLFLPAFLMEVENATLLPGLAGVEHLLVWRGNLDPMRLSLELTLLGALWLTVRWVRRRAVGYGIAVLYLLTFAYYVYEAIVLSVFLVEPNFYSQYYWASDGLPFLAQHLEAGWWLYAAAALGVVAGAALMFTLVRLWLRSGAAPRIHSTTRVVMLLLAGYSLFVAVRYQFYTAQQEMVVSSIGYKLQENLAASVKLQADVAGFDDRGVRAAYDYSAYQLARKPDIYFIFVESYGSVLYKRPDYLLSYTALLDELNATLTEAGWHTTSALSKSTTWGGGSWMAYTSTLLGLRIDNHPQYLALLDTVQVESFPSLGRTLANQGYHHVWLSAMSENLGERTWAKYLRLNGADELIRNRDLGYVGPQYGWGPSPPDQYVLNYTQEQLAQRVDQPLFLFTITQNSHYPWTPQPELVEDWRTLNQVQPPVAEIDPDSIEHSEKRQNYLSAIENQLRILTDFMLRHGDENSIFVLIGDHQPPQVSRRADGWETPVHIVSRDADLIAAFAEYGFGPGLEVQPVEPALRHEGIYSLFMRVLLSQYGANQTNLPEYLPNGADRSPPREPVAQ
jgi:phosphoglycerol transferase MdoB-like AlkP superfamily enzyme